MITLTGITKNYQMGDQTVQALRGVDLHIERNELVAFIGTSGSGKSTLMNIVGCLDRPSSGTYQLNGRDVATMESDELALVRNAEIGFIFQSFHLLPRATALDNVAQPLIYRGIHQKERNRLAAEALDHVGLGSRMHHRPNELSGGQRQRVAIARALVGKPAILLADEPTGNLDSSTSLEILELIKEVHRNGQTVVMVTHEPEIADQCHRIVRLSDGRVLSDTRKDQGFAMPAVTDSTGD
ncbi:ABC transporter ATP-binding protein [Undibacterium fentianense]|uniref:ABC transporter ATP-binding protein n=1 Tax=Undibacterium fentianense TaxID=2828728 RepID=A0A941DZX1_9BURK|nr:ABC transporter ATP-binding protein [Undibacterium fentianense]MBR7799885.1 ABC transporter ATP-binding protein [Undibacterium fentianense]